MSLCVPLWMASENFNWKLLVVLVLVLFLVLVLVLFFRSSRASCRGGVNRDVPALSKSRVAVPGFEECLMRYPILCSCV